MIELFLKLHPVVQMMLVSFTSIIILIILKKGYTIARTKDGWIFGPKKKDEEEVKNPHMECEHYEDYKNTLFNLAKLGFKLGMLETKQELIDCQLDYAVKKGDGMIGIMRSLYLSKLAEKRGSSDDVTRSRSFILYEIILEDIVQSKVYVILKTIFRRKYFADLSEAEFRIEKEDSIKSIMQKITEIIDKKYIYDDEISRVELFELNNTKKQEIINEFNDIFDQSRVFAFDHKKKIDELNEKIQLLLSGKKVEHGLEDIKDV